MRRILTARCKSRDKMTSTVTFKVSVSVPCALKSGDERGSGDIIRREPGGRPLVSRDRLQSLGVTGLFKAR